MGRLSNESRRMISTSLEQEEGLLLCHFGPYNKKPGHYWLEYVSYVIGEHQPLVVENISSERQNTLCNIFILIRSVTLRNFPS